MRNLSQRQLSEHQHRNGNSDMPQVHCWEERQNDDPAITIKINKLL